MEMTITEGLKKLRLLEKRIGKNCEEIERYSSLLSNEKPIFDTEAKQREEVKKLIQANMDLEAEYCKIKAMVDYTNLRTVVVIDDESRTIHGWLTVLRKTGSLLIKTYRSLSTQEASRSQMRFRDKEGSTPMLIRLYDENDKRAGERKWEDLTSGKTIEGRLEVVNATTILLTPPTS
jgi:hypothetical protein